MMLAILALAVDTTIAQPTASIALDKMNVLYVGVDNPISVASSAATDDKIEFSITGAGGSFRTANSKFRVRTIPTPIAQVGPYTNGSNVPAGGFKAQPGVAAFAPNFAFDLVYKVISFVISCDTRDGVIEEAQCQGNTWSAEARRIVNDLKPGRIVMIDAIRAIGPDGRVQRLPSLVYYIR